MKTTILSLGLIFVILTTYAGTVNSPDDYFVKTKNRVIYFTKISVGTNNVKLILDNGEKMVLMNQEVIAYKKNGQIFEKLPFYTKNKNTDREVFMELLKYKNGMKLYRYRTFETEPGNPLTYNSATLVYNYYVYKNGTYHLQIDARNYKTVFGFFGIEAKWEE